MSSSTLELTPTPAQSSDVSTAPDAVLAEAQRISEEEIFAAHEGGKLSVELTDPLVDRRDLSIAYTPGVAQVSRAIAAKPEGHRFNDVGAVDQRMWQLGG